MSIKSENKAIAKASQVTRGSWVKVGAYYESNAYDIAEHHYAMSITKEDEGWIFFCEDHNPEDIDENKPFKTLSEAKVFAEKFGEYFQHCWEQNTEFVSQLISDKIQIFGIDMTGFFLGTDRMVESISEAVRYKYTDIIPYGFRLVAIEN